MIETLLYFVAIDRWFDKLPDLANSNQCCQTPDNKENLCQARFLVLLVFKLYR